MTKLLVGGAIAVFGIAAGPAGAQPAPPPPPGVFSEAAPAPRPPLPSVAPLPPQMHMMMMSGRPMARDEVVRHVRDLFARLDANRDGYLTRAEIEAAHQSMMGAMHAGMGKRFADRGVPPTDRAAMFDRLDANHDGSITREEFMAARPPMQQRRMVFMRADPDGGPGAPGGPGMKMRMHRAGMRFGGRLFDMADANRDGRVSLAEAQAAALRHFDRLDLNHDGVLSPEERQQAHQFMRERHPS